MSDEFCIVLGGTGAIGRAVIEALRQRRMSVLATYRSRVPSAREGVTWVRFDSEDSAASNVALYEHGQESSAALRALFHCIGKPSSKSRVADTEVDEYRSLFDVNVLSLVIAYHAFAQIARRSKTRITVLSSSSTGALKSGNGAYSASKCALEALAITLAREEQEFGVRVNVLAPSLVRSSLAEVVLARQGEEDVEAAYARLNWGRPLSVKEVADVMLAMALGSEWEYMTGQVVRLSARD